MQTIVTKPQIEVNEIYRNRLNLAPNGVRMISILGVSEGYWGASLLSIIARKIVTHCKEMSKTACVILAPGTEEMELTISADVLRRAGIAVTVAGLQGADEVKCSRDVVIKPDAALEKLADSKFDVIVMPGGLGGSKAMAESKLLCGVLQKQECEGRKIAAICAAPVALAAHGIGVGKSLTCYPSVKDQLASKYKYVDDDVVVDGNLITSQGPGTAFCFALKIIEILVGEEKKDIVAQAMLLK